MRAAPSGGSLRHPLRAAREELTRLATVARRGESAETPGVLISGIALVLVPLVSIIIALAFAVGYVGTRESAPSPPVTAPASAERVSLPREPQPLLQTRKEAVVEDFWTIVAYAVLVGIPLVPIAVFVHMWREAGRRRAA